MSSPSLHLYHRRLPLTHLLGAPRACPTLSTRHPCRRAPHASPNFAAKPPERRRTCASSLTRATTSFSLTTHRRPILAIGPTSRASPHRRRCQSRRLPCSLLVLFFFFLSLSYLHVALIWHTHTTLPSSPSSLTSKWAHSVIHSIAL